MRPKDHPKNKEGDSKHDSEIEIGRVPAVLAQEESKDRQAPQFRHVFIAQQGQSA